MTDLSLAIMHLWNYKIREGGGTSEEWHGSILPAIKILQEAEKKAQNDGISAEYVDKKSTYHAKKEQK